MQAMGGPLGRRRQACCVLALSLLLLVGALGPRTACAGKAYVGPGPRFLTGAGRRCEMQVRVHLIFAAREGQIQR